MPEHTTKADSDRLESAVGALVAHLHDDLPAGPRSLLDGEVFPNTKVIRRKSEIQRLSAIGKAILQAPRAERVTVRNKKQL